MKLIKTTLELMCEILPFDSIWRVDYQHSVMNLTVRKNKIFEFQI